MIENEVRENEVQAAGNQPEQPGQQEKQKGGQKAGQFDDQKGGQHPGQKKPQDQNLDDDNDMPDQANKGGKTRQ